MEKIEYYKYAVTILILLCAIAVLTAYIAVEQNSKRMTLSVSCNPYSLEKLGEKECHATLTLPNGQNISLKGTYEAQLYEMHS